MRLCESTVVTQQPELQVGDVVTLEWIARRGESAGVIVGEIETALDQTGTAAILAAYSFGDHGVFERHRSVNAAGTARLVAA